MDDDLFVSAIQPPSAETSVTAGATAGSAASVSDGTRDSASMEHPLSVSSTAAAVADVPPALQLRTHTYDGHMDTATAAPPAAGVPLAAAAANISLSDDSDEDAEDGDPNDGRAPSGACSGLDESAAGGDGGDRCEQVTGEQRSSPLTAANGGPIGHPPAPSAIAAPASATAASATDTEELVPAQEGDDDYINIFVLEPVKIGDGMLSFLAYKVLTKTNLPGFKARQFSVMRRFSDFLGLHDKLMAKHLHTGRIVPPPPDKQVIGTTMMKIQTPSSSSAGSPGTESSTARSPASTTATASTSAQDRGGGGGTQCGNHSDFVERRRAALQRYLQRLTRHPQLLADPQLVEFLQLDDQLPRASHTSAFSSAGVLRLFSRVGDKVTNKMAAAAAAATSDESADTWFVTAAEQFDALDSQLRKLHASMDGLVAHRRDMAHSAGQLASTIAVLSNVEEHTGLSRALSQLSEVHEELQRLHAAQADGDFFILCELFNDYILLLGAVKNVFHERQKLYQTLQAARKTTVKKRNELYGWELRGQTHRVDQVKIEVAEWEAKSVQYREEFERMSSVMKDELSAFNDMWLKDIKRGFIQHFESLYAYQQKISRQWERFLPEVTAILSANK